MISGNYPDYESIIPKEQENKSLVSLSILKDRLARVNLYVDKSKKLILTFSELQLKLLGEDLITGRKGEFLLKIRTICMKDQMKLWRLIFHILLKLLVFLKLRR